MTSSDRLVARYEEAERELIDTIAKKEAKGNVTAYHKSLLRQTRAVLAKLRRDTPPLVNAVVEDGYRLGLAQSKADNSTVFSILDERQVALLELNMRAELLRGVNLVGRHMEDALRAAALEANAQKITTGQTVRDMQKKLTAALTGAKDDALVYFEGGKIGVRYRNGRVVALSKYTAMVARTTTAEAATRADLQRGEEWGFDLCVCNAHSPTCEICAMYAGRTYATTREAANGKYYGLRFPYLYDTALNRGYQVIHPNCKHNFTAISADAYTEAELTKMSRRSMQPFEDTRSDAERRAYAKQQEYNRKLRADEAQYNRVRAVVPDEAPKNFGAFRNMKRANSERYQDLMKDYGYVLREINPPRTLTAPDTTLQATVGADFMDGVIPKDADITKVRVIAGAGTSSKLRISDELANKYGGDALQWQKKGGIIAGENFTYDVHWYERDGVQYEARPVSEPKRIRK